MRDRPDPDPERDEEDTPSGEAGPHGRLRPTSLAVVLGWGVTGLVVGWAIPPVSARLGWVPPLVTWTQPLTLALVPAILGYVAWATWRTLHARHEQLVAEQAVARFVLARSSALVCALAAGGYLGYGLSWVRAETDNGRLWPSLTAAMAGVLGVVAALLLERACRIRNSGPSA